MPTSLLDLIVWRRLSRAPSQLVAAVLVAGAVALGTFTTMTAGTADALGVATAQARTAAGTVLHVRTPDRLPLMSAVARADPGGRQAMAAVEARIGVGPASIIAVDTDRLSAVSAWRSDWAGLDAAALRRRLAPPVHPSLTLLGTRLTLTTAHLTAGVARPTGADRTRFQLELTVQSPRGLSVVRSDPFQATGDPVFRLPIPCANGCTFVSLGAFVVTVVTDSDRSAYPWSMDLLLTGMSTDVEPAERFQAVLQHGSWMNEFGHVEDQTLPISSTARPGPPGLAIDLTDANGAGHPAVRIRDTVEPLPAVLGAITTADQFPGSPGTILGEGVDGTPLLLHTAGRASDLPRLLGDGVLLDLPRMLPQIDRGSTGADEQVWVSGDPRSVERRLRAEGVAVLRTETLDADIRLERAEAAPASSRFAIIGALAALAVVLIALLGGRLLAAPARRRQWSSFAAAGVPVPRMRRLIAIEFFAPAAAAILVGALSGAATFLLALPHLPLSDAAPDGPPADVLLPWGLAGVFPAVALLVVAGMAAVVSRLETRAVERRGAA